jgi:hypothetical protein
VLNTAAAHDVAHADVVRRIQKRHCSTAPIHQTVESFGIARITTEDAMMTQLPNVTRLGHRHRGSQPRIDRVSRVGGVLLEINGQLVNLDRRKSRNRNVDPFSDQQFGELGQFEREDLAVPTGVLTDLVVGERQCPFLGSGARTSTIGTSVTSSDRAAA